MSFEQCGRIARAGCDSLEDLGLDSSEGERRGSRLCRDRSRQGGDDDRAGLSLPVRVHDGALSSSDVVVVPVPSLGVDGLADGSDDPQALEAVVLDKVLAKPSEKSDRGRCGVEVGDLVLVNRLPVSGRVRVDGRRLKDDGRHSTAEREQEGRRSEPGPQE